MNYEKIIDDQLKYVKKQIEKEIGEKYTLLELSHLANSLGLDTENVDESQVTKECMQDNNKSSIAYYLKLDDSELLDYYINYAGCDFINIVIEKFNKSLDIDLIDLDSEWIIKEVEIL